MTAFLVQPLTLNDQHSEYVLAGYAAFQQPAKILAEFEACFPESVATFSASHDNWKKRLLVAIQYLYPGHPKFDTQKWGSIFSGLRRNYLHSVKDSMLSSARARLAIMETTLEKLDAHAAENPESFVECKKLQLDVLKQAKVESYDYFGHQAMNVGSTEEEMKKELRTCTAEEIVEFKERCKEGEDPFSVIKDIKSRTIVVKNNEAQETE